MTRVPESAHLLHFKRHMSAPIRVKVHVFIVNIYLCVHQSYRLRITVVIGSPGALV